MIFTRLQSTCLLQMTWNPNRLPWTIFTKGAIQSNMCYLATVPFAPCCVAWIYMKQAHPHPLPCTVLTFWLDSSGYLSNLHSCSQPWEHVLAAIRFLWHGQAQVVQHAHGQHPHLVCKYLSVSSACHFILFVGMSSPSALAMEWEKNGVLRDKARKHQLVTCQNICKDWHMYSSYAGT